MARPAMPAMQDCILLMSIIYGLRDDIRNMEARLNTRLEQLENHLAAVHTHIDECRNQLKVDIHESSVITATCISGE